MSSYTIKWILISVKYENRWEINVILSCCLNKMVFSEFLLGPHVKICPKLSSCGQSPYLQPVDRRGARYLETATGERQYSLRSKDESIKQSTPAWTSWKAPKSLPTTVVFRIIITSITVNFPGHHVSIFNSIKILLVLALINSDCISQNGLFHWKHLCSNMSSQDSFLAFIKFIIAEFSRETVVSCFKSRSFDGIWCSVSFCFKY